MLSITNSSITYIATAFVGAFLFSTLFSGVTARVLCLIPPAFLSYSLFFRMNKASEADFEQRMWHAERMRGLAAGSDVDGDGKVTDEERTRESAEWANALVRGLWPIVNTDLFSSLIDMLEDIMQSSVPKFIVSSSWRCCYVALLTRCPSALRPRRGHGLRLKRRPHNVHPVTP